MQGPSGRGDRSGVGTGQLEDRFYTHDLTSLFLPFPFLFTDADHLDLMRSSVVRFFSASTRARSLLATSCAPKMAPEGLPAVRHHVFRTPLPYLVGLKLQNDIIDMRLAAKAKDAMDPVARQDVLLLLGA